MKEDYEVTVKDFGNDVLFGKRISDGTSVAHVVAQVEDRGEGRGQGSNLRRAGHPRFGGAQDNGDEALRMEARRDRLPRCD